MNFNHARLLMLASGLATVLGVSPALAAPPTSTGPMVVYKEGVGDTPLLVSGVPTWIDVPGLSTTITLPKAAAVVVSYNVTIQNGVSVDPVVCSILLRAVINNTDYTATVVAVPPSSTSSGAQTIANPSIAGTVAIKVQALNPNSACTNVLVSTTTLNFGSWGPTMTVMVLR